MLNHREHINKTLRFTPLRIFNARGNISFALCTNRKGKGVG
jgi:hypothetical protein